MTRRYARLALSLALVVSVCVFAPASAGAVVLPESQISPDVGYQYEPDIYGGKVVWQQWDASWTYSAIVLHDLAAGTETTVAAATNPNEVSEPHIWGDWVIWKYWGGAVDVSDVRAYRISTGQTYDVTTDLGVRQEWLDIGPGNGTPMIAWEDWRAGGGSTNIWSATFNGTNWLESEVTSGGADRDPAIGESFGAFERSGSTLFVKPLTVFLPAVEVGSFYGQPAMDGKRVCYMADRDGDNVFTAHTYDCMTGIDTTIPLGAEPYASADWMEVGDGTMLFTHDNGVDFDIYRYDFTDANAGGTETLFKGGTGYQQRPAIDPTGSGYIVWMDSRTGSSRVWANVALALTDTQPPVTVTDLKAAYDGTATIGFSATDDMSGVQGIYRKLDGGAVTMLPAVTTYTITVTTPGTHTVEYWAKDNALNEETHRVGTFLVRSVDTAYTEVEGTDRYFTAIDASKEAFPTGIPAADYQGYKTVVIATGSNWPDALGAAGLAGALGGPVLLVQPTALPSAVAAEITRLGATRAIVVGGAGAVGGNVMTALGSVAGVTKVERISGTDRFQTASAVASKTVAALGSGFDGTAFVASGLDFPDALAGAPLSAKYGWPLYLCGSGGLSADTVVAMDAAHVSGALLLGGTKPVPAATETSLKTKYGAAKVKRLWGADRYLTAIAIARHGVDSGRLRWDGVGIATGEDYPDALAGGVLVGRTGSVILLTRRTALTQVTGDELRARRDLIGSVRYLGGDEAVSPAVRSAIAAILK
ncbi:MAG: hypothetical protein C0418_05880 [Coriobacteriaceae bacterium]|nr:hypothetical protein [Coriobacteriaceae bacterium]